MKAGAGLLALLLHAVGAVGGGDASERGVSLLAGLPPLPKPHYSWPRYLPRREGTVNDTEATLVDYARITHSLPLYLGRLPSHGAEAEWEQSVRICHQVNCTLALNWSPWYEKMPGHMGPADPTYSGPEEAEEMAMFAGLLANASAALERLNAARGSSVKVGAVLLDSEKQAALPLPLPWPPCPFALPSRSA